MPKFSKFFLVLFVIQMSIQFSTAMYDIYRGNIDMYSRDILIPKHVPKKCGVEDYCSCGESTTFTYDIRSQKGKCVKNNDFRVQSSCKQVSHFDTSFGTFVQSSIGIVRQDSTTTEQFIFSAEGTCTWKSTRYTVYGDNWLPTESNPGSISVVGIFFKTLQIGDSGALLSMYPGMLLNIQIECRKSTSSDTITNQICLLLKIEGHTNITAYPVSTTSLPTMITTFPAFPTASPTPTTPATPSPTSSTTSSDLSEMPVISQTEGPNTQVPKLPIASTSIPADPENGESGGDENDSSSLVLILVPVLLLFVLLVVLYGVFLYRRRQRSMSTNIDKDFYDDNTLPHHATLTKAPRGSPPSYAVPESQINTTPINDTIYENTNLPRENSPNYYEFEDDDYTTYDDGNPTNSEVNRNPADHTSPESSYTNPSSNIYQDIDFNQAPGPTVNSRDNLGYIDQSNEDPYYYSLENGTLNENIYDRVTEEPQEHVYSVLEKPN